jgi:hypothetical protein
MEQREACGNGKDNALNVYLTGIGQPESKV